MDERLSASRRFSDVSLAYLALGSNVGNRRRFLRDAIVGLQAQGVHVVQRSSLYETAPQDELDQPWFLNQVIAIETLLTPEQLLQLTQQLEVSAGRQRTVFRGPRTLDIDILLYEGTTRDEPALTIPHPRMYSRRFVLEPLSEIAPHLVNEPMLAAVQEQALRRLADD